MLRQRDYVERMNGEDAVCPVMSSLDKAVWGARAVYFVRLDESQVQVSAGKC